MEIKWLLPSWRTSRRWRGQVQPLYLKVTGLWRGCHAWAKIPRFAAIAIHAVVIGTLSENILPCKHIGRSAMGNVFVAEPGSVGLANNDVNILNMTVHSECCVSLSNRECRHERCGHFQIKRLFRTNEARFGRFCRIVWIVEIFRGVENKVSYWENSSRWRISAVKNMNQYLCIGSRRQIEIWHGAGLDFDTCCKHKGFFRLRQSLFSDLISLHRAARSFTSGVVLKIRSDNKCDSKSRYDSGEPDLSDSPPARHWWIAFGVLFLLGSSIGFARGIWLFADGTVGRGVTFVLFAVAVATAGAVILCLA